MAGVNHASQGGAGQDSSVWETSACVVFAAVNLLRQPRKNSRELSMECGHFRAGRGRYKFRNEGLTLRGCGEAKPIEGKAGIGLGDEDQSWVKFCGLGCGCQRVEGRSCVFVVRGLWEW